MRRKKQKKPTKGQPRSGRRRGIRLGAGERLRAGIAEIFGVHQETVGAWVRDGCPHRRGRRRRLIFNIGAVEKWIESTGRSLLPGRPPERAITEMDSARLRKELALAQRHEMNLAVQRGEYVGRADVQAGMVRRVLAVKDALYGMLEPAAEEMENKPAAEIRELLRTRIEAILRLFSGGESDAGTGQPG